MEPDLNNLPEAEKKLEETITEENFEVMKKILNETYEKIINFLKNYSDINEDYYDLVAIWIIGTYIYDSFETYPYLFINAMRGSGKTRLLKIIKTLSKNGDLLTSLKEAVLFRTAKGKTLCIDELESINKKENAGLRELLNACYKKGIKVKRMRKVKNILGEEQQVEEFEPYTPIAMANIWGIEEVLGDRCITMILEKSNNERIMKVVEDFDNILETMAIKSTLESILAYMRSYIRVYGYIHWWNSYVNERCAYASTLTTLTTQTALSTLEKIKMEKLFNRIWDTGINGRNLELMFSLIMIANLISDEVLEKMLRIATNLTKEKKEEEMVESREISLVDFISKLENNTDFISIKELTSRFRESMGEEEEEDKWLNPKWVGKALKRLCLILQKRRMHRGIEVMLNYGKAVKFIDNLKFKQVVSIKSLVKPEENQQELK